MVVMKKTTRAYNRKTPRIQSLQKQKTPPVYDTIIVGAGPAGLFAAYELSRLKPKTKILIIEQGKPLEDRLATDTVSGVGGSGTYSDGKLHFTLELSHEKLLDLFSREEYQKELEYVDTLFTSFGVTAPYTPKNLKDAEELVHFCQKNGVHLYIRKCRHVGSDFLPKVIKRMVSILKRRGVDMICNTKIETINTKDGHIENIATTTSTFKAKNYMLAPGRLGASWLQRQARTIGLHYMYQKVEIGVRVEFPAAIMEEHSRILHENIYSVRTPTYDNVVRTFCPCPNGKVAIENYGDYICVNGYSNAGSKTKNSNFNLTTEVQLTQPVENTTDYAISIAKTATIIGGGKPILQRLADLQSGRRSTWERISRSYVTPTLLDVTPGDISMALPHRIVASILEGIVMLDRVLPGLNSGSTLLYAPEVKLRGNRIKVNRSMQTEIPNLYVAGDGAGTSGNIVGAAISGIFAARGIIANTE
jgi:uncharacterized FAD-dependent dehydrogenase